MDINPGVSRELGRVETSPKDVFLHLLMIVTLLMSVVSFISLLFQYVNVLMPDPLDYGNPYDSIRWATAVLIVSFPIFIWLSSLIEKELKSQPAKREILIRKGLIYVTLFIAAIVIIIDLITLIYNFYGGDLTTRFLLKSLVVLVAASAIFGYYRWELQRSDVSHDLPKKLAWGVSVVVVISILAGFFIAGSPAEQRLVRLDAERLAHLQSIQFDIVTFWQETERLPENLSELRDELLEISVPTDPLTGTSYEYRVTGDLSFELCAEFQTDSSSARTVSRPHYPSFPGFEDESWDHEEGRHCFERTINPERIKSNVNR